MTTSPAPAPPPSLASPEELLRLEEEKAERQINGARLALSGAFLLLFMGFYLNAEQHYTSGYVILGAMICWLAYSLWLKWQIGRGNYQPWQAFSSVSVDLLVMASIFVSAKFLNYQEAAAGSQNVLAFLFLLVALTALRQNMAASLFTGVAAAVIYLASSLIVQHVTGVRGQVIDHILVAGALLGVSAIATLAARRQRMLLLRTAEAERRRAQEEHEWRVNRLTQEVSERTAELAAAKEEAEQHALELEAVRQATLSLTASLTLDAVLCAIVSSTWALLAGIRNAHIFLYQEDPSHPDGGKVAYGAAIEKGKLRSDAFYTPRSDGLTMRVARSGETILVQQMLGHPLYAEHNHKTDWLGSIVGIPLKIGSRVVGVMNVSYPQPHMISERHLRILGLLADHAAIAIENARLHELVERQARTDALSGLHNRRALDERLEDELRRAIRYRRVFSLAIMDLDKFKEINDTYGHPVGDYVLKQVTDCLAENRRDTDFLARLGGDEFALLMPETDQLKAEQVGVRLQAALAATPISMPDGSQRHLSTSLGLSTYPQDGDSAAALMEKADQRLYQKKGRER